MRDETFAQVLSFFTLAIVAGLVVLSMAVDWPLLSWETLSGCLANVSYVAQAVMALLAIGTLGFLWHEFRFKKTRHARQDEEHEKNIDMQATRETHTVSGEATDLIRLRVTNGGARAMRLIEVECDSEQMQLLARDSASRLLGPRHPGNSSVWIFQRTHSLTGPEPEIIDVTLRWTDLHGSEHREPRQVMLQ